MENQTKDKQENVNPVTAPVATPVQQAPAVNQDADMMAALFKEKITEKLEREIKSLREQLKEYTEERKSLGTNEREPLRLTENKYKNKGVIQLD
jgi:ribosome-associated translation inhibitor RaiA